MALTKIQAAGLTADLIDETKLADDSIDSEHYNDGSIDTAHIADLAVTTGKIASGQITEGLVAIDAIDETRLKISNAGSNGQFLSKQSGDSGGLTWATPTDTNTQLSTEQVQDIVGAMFTGNTETNITATYEDSDGTIDLVSTDTNTTYSVGDGGLTTNDFTNADHTKLDGIAASANNYVHPNHSGEVTSTADGATVIADDVVDEANLKVSNSPTNGYFLSAQSGNTGGLTWAEAGGGVSSDSERNTVAGTNAGDSFTGTDATDNTLLGYDAGTAITSGDHNVAIGSYTLDANTTGYGHTAVGKGALTTNNTGYKNTGIGEGAAGGNTTGNENTAVGYRALHTNETASSNVAIGAMSMYATTAQGNSAVGAYAGYSLTTGTNNAILGNSAGYNLSTSHHSVYIGQTCGYAITTGYENVAIGGLAFKETGVNAYGNVVLGYNAGTKIDGYNNVVAGRNAHVFGTTCLNNVAIGYDALKGSSGNTTADNCVCVGGQAGFSITSGGINTLIGSMAGYNITSADGNTLIGREAGKAVNTGVDNICIGVNAGNQTNAITTGQKNICIGNYTHPDAVDGIYQTVVGYNMTGKGSTTTLLQGNCYNTANTSAWQTTSDRRIKKNIVDNNDGLSKINSIRVRNFEYRTFDEITELDNPAAAVVKKEGTQLGVIAQEIMEVLPDVVQQESSGAYSVNPDNLTWYLVNAVKELSAKVTELEGKLNG